MKLAYWIYKTTHSGRFASFYQDGNFHDYSSVVCHSVPNGNSEPALPYDIEIESKLLEISSTPLTEENANQFYQLILVKAKLAGKEPYPFLMDYYQSIEAPKKILRSEALIATGTRSGYPVHHMRPKFDGGLVIPENEVVVTFLEHVLAHYVRWRILGKSQDRTAFLFAVDMKAEALALIEKTRRTNYNIFLEENPDHYSKMGKKGGLIGGKLGSKTDKIRAGILGGIAKQKPELTEFLTSYAIWFYCKKSQNIFFLIGPHIALKDVAKVLNEQSGVSSIKQPSNLSGTISGEKNHAYGWTPLLIFNQSEVKMGVKNWIINYPDKTLIVESGLDLTVL